MIFNKLKSRVHQISRGDALISAVVAIASDSLIYLLGAVLLGLGNFLLVPIYTRYLPPADFGVFALLEITVIILVTVSQLGFGVSYLKWFAEMGEAHRGELLGSVLTVSGLVSLVSGGIFSFLVFSPFGGNWLDVSNRLFAWMLLPIVFFETIQLLLLSDLRAQRKPQAYATSTVFRLIVILGASYWFIVVEQMGLVGVFFGRMSGDAAGIFSLSLICLRETKLHLSVEIISPMLRYGMPIVWSALIAMLLDATGRYFLNHYSTTEQVGYYAASIKIAGVFQLLITQPFGIAWGGLMFQIAKWPNARKVYSKILEYLFLLSLSTALVIAVFTPTLFNVFTTSSYAAAMAIFPLILLVRAVNIMEYPTSIGLYLGNQTQWFILIYAAGFVLNIIMNLWLVPEFGMLGSSWAWLSAWVTIVSLMAILGQKYYPLDYNTKFIFIPALVWCVILATGYNEFFSKINPWYSISITLLVITGVAILIISDYFRERDKLVIKETSTSNKS